MRTGPTPLAVAIHWDSASGPVLGNAFGPSFSVAVTIPSSATAGTHIVVAVANNGFGPWVQSFQVTTSIPPGSAGPIVGTVTPVAGPASGGTAVTITGSGFTGATGVSFAKTPASRFSVVSDSEITATSPAAQVGAADVVVSTPQGETPISAGDQFTFTAGSGANPSAAAANPGPAGLIRLGGQDRLATAISVSQAGYHSPGSAHAVVLARSDQFADALAGVPLAAAKGGPLLLTPPGSLDPATQAEIQRVLSTGANVYLLGGSGALDPSIDAALSGLGYNPVRLAGGDRFATAVAIAGVLGNPGALFEVTGADFPDAVSAGPAAIAAGGAILLTNGRTQASETFAYLAAHMTAVRVAIGGPAGAADPGAAGVGGPDRYSTSAAVASRAFPAPKTIGLATGLSFADALSGGSLVGGLGGPILLVPPSGPLPSSIASYLGAHSAGLTADSAFVFGGTSAVGADVATAAQVATHSG